MGPEVPAPWVRYLKDQNIEVAWSLDEGSFILDGVVPGVSKNVALINVAEKGYVTLDLVATGQGGHSSMPPEDGAVVLLAEAIVKLRNAPVPGGLDGLSGDAYDALARHMPFSQRMAFANKWLFGGLVEGMLSRIPAGNAMLRTTTAHQPCSKPASRRMCCPSTPWRRSTSVCTRVIHASRSLRMSAESWVTALRCGCARAAGEASPVASTTSAGYTAIARAARETVGDLVIAPGLTGGGETDSKHYAQIAEDAYRFHPFIVGPDDVPTIHGTNERHLDRQSGAGNRLPYPAAEGDGGTCGQVTRPRPLRRAGSGRARRDRSLRHCR